MSSEQLFRNSALERLSSPEQLDRLVVITDPMGWLSLGTIALLVASALAWGMFGSIPYKVNGQGMLISEGVESTMPCLQLEARFLKSR